MIVSYKEGVNMLADAGGIGYGEYLQVKNVKHRIDTVYIFNGKKIKCFLAIKTDFRLFLDPKIAVWILITLAEY